MRMRTVVGVLCLIGVVGALLNPAVAGTLGVKGDGIPDVYIGVDPATGALDTYADGVWLDLDGAQMNGATMYLNGFTVKTATNDLFHANNNGKPADDSYRFPTGQFQDRSPKQLWWGMFPGMGVDPIGPKNDDYAPAAVGSLVKLNNRTNALLAPWNKVLSAAENTQLLADITALYNPCSFDENAWDWVTGAEAQLGVILTKGGAPPVHVPPTIDPIGGLVADVTGPEGWMKTFAWDLSQYYKDADGDTPTKWELVGETHGATLNAATGILQWQPNYNWDHVGAPPAMFGVQVTDSGQMTSAVRDFDITVVPEPGTIVMLLSGALLGLALWRRRHS